MIIKAIETLYKGYRFRSRLEARWAVFFDALGAKWEYEKEGFELGKEGRYLPDFWLPGLGVFAEVKPREFTKGEWDKCASLSEACLILDGIPEHRGFWITLSNDCPDAKDRYIEYISRDTSSSSVIVLSESFRKGTLWYLFGSDIDMYDCPKSAITTARSARFEHGELPGS